MTPAGEIADIAIIGAGAAGLAAAIFAAEETRRLQHRLSIVLVDGAKKPGAKILVSGGGRCNVTNEKVTPEDFCGGSSKIIRNVLLRFNEQQTLHWMQSLGVDLKLEPTGKYFPVTDSARTVLDALMNRVNELGIESRFGWRVRDIVQGSAGSPDTAPEWLLINAANNSVLRARQLIIATGGRALPKSGSDGAGYAWLERLGHTIVPPVPALAPLVLDERGVPGSPFSTAFAQLSGISIDARLSFGHVSYYGPVLFTHFGLSGPIAMNLSRHIARARQEDPARPVQINLSIPLPVDAEFTNSMGQKTRLSYDAWLLGEIQRHPQMTIANALGRIMPERLAMCLASAVEAHRLADMRKEDRQRLGQLLQSSPLAVKGDRGFAFAETTAGGVALDEVNWKSMRSRKAENIYLCGEVLDVDGRIGGFNFQWAWATGHIAGKSAAGIKD
jgi:predicted Rossmann fold flavoprotein